MWPVSDLFLQALRRPHGMAARVELWDATGKRLTSALDVTGGSVTLDRSSDVYATCEVTAALLPGGALVGAPDVDLTDINIYGLVLCPYRGVRFPGGTVEEVPLGRYLLTEFRTSDGDPEVSLTGVAFRGYLRDAQFPAPVSYPGQPIRQIMLALINEGLPEPARPAPYNRDEWNALPATVVPVGTVFDSDRLAALDQLATSLGVECFPDRRGIWRFRPAAQSGPPAWRADAGPDGVLIQAHQGVKRDQVYNLIVARGEATGSDAPPVQGQAAITSPTSPVRVNGPFGVRTRFYSSPLLTTVQQCQAAARTLLARYSVADTIVDATTVPNPALDPGDAVQVAGTSRIARTFTVDAVQVPLTPDGTLALATRERPNDEGTADGP
ncbi:DUF5047 domain-containing protein [Actinomadura graeca]|uniref:DUF5047 domain-containing protein n=1 Tax=Actinomadura graeca TaxID=2750812 RepID=A0ABX8QMC5_9ACTN|nr:DUF5047 domain-containing protein [Actinomadura graeca]QXJ19605.1 DUF5047 domain-containing protein [Actinomadura graeca]